MTALSVRFILRWLVVVLFLITTMPGRAQDGYLYVGKFGDDLLLAPHSVVTDPESGKIYVSDPTHQQVFEFDADYSLRRRFGNGRGPELGGFQTPFDMVIVNGNLFVEDISSYIVQVFDLSNGMVVDSWEPIISPWGMAKLINGSIAVGTQSKIRFYALNGTVQGEIGNGYGVGNGQFSIVTGIAQGVNGNLFVTDINNNRVQVLSPSGQWIANWVTGGTMTAAFQPYKVAVNGDMVFVSDHGNSVVKVFSYDGEFRFEINAPSGMNRPIGLCLDRQGKLLVADVGNKCIRIFEPYWNDTTPPTSVATLTPVPDANGWTRGTSMNVTATDDASGNGVKEIRYQINEGAIAVVPAASASVPFTSDGVFTVKTWAVDAANNVEPPHTTTIKVDSTSPLSVAKLDKRTFSVSATDAVSGVASILVSIDGGTETVYSGPIALDINEHTLSYRALDIAGNAEAPRTVTLGGIRISKLAATPSTVKGGADFVVAAVLNSPAPSGGVSLTITSNAAAVTGTSVVIPEGELLALVSLKTVPVASDMSVVLSSLLGVSSASTTVTVLAEPLKLAVAPADIIGGANTLGTVTLLSAAPQGGTKVVLTSGSSLVSVPSSITVKAGKTTAVFTVRTKTVSATNTVNISAKTGVAESVETLTLRTPELINLDIDPSEVGTGGTTSGTIHLSCPAPTGGVKVTLTSSSKNLVVPATVVVAQGEVSADFIVKALPVTSPSASDAVWPPEIVEITETIAI